MLVMLGAKIGANVVLTHVTVSNPDLLTIDDGAKIGFASNLRAHSFQNGTFIMGAGPLVSSARRPPHPLPLRGPVTAPSCAGPVHIMRSARVGMRVVTQPFTTVGALASLGPLSTLDIGSTVPSGRIYRSWLST
jgi:acetyltransferase-like isoleucine patch superfamily enzyme